MPHGAEWGTGWALLAYGVSWAVMIGYLRYVNSRVERAREALTREEDF